MATMATLSVHVSGTTYNLYQHVIEMSKEDKIPEKEVNKTFCELIETARLRRNENRFGTSHLPARPSWSELNFYLIEGWLTYHEVYNSLNHLVQFGRYLPIPKRAKVNWPLPRKRDCMEA